MNLIHPKTLGLSETSKMTVPEAQKRRAVWNANLWDEFCFFGWSVISKRCFPLTKPQILWLSFPETKRGDGKRKSAVLKGTNKKYMGVS